MNPSRHATGWEERFTHSLRVRWRFCGNSERPTNAATDVGSHRGDDPRPSSQGHTKRSREHLHRPGGYLGRADCSFGAGVFRSSQGSMHGSRSLGPCRRPEPCTK